MEYSTPKALKKIISANHKKILVNGAQSCPLKAMSVAFNYHKVDIKETSTSLNVVGTVPVTSSNKFMMK